MVSYRLFLFQRLYCNVAVSLSFSRRSRD